MHRGKAHGKINIFASKPEHYNSVLLFYNSIVIIAHASQDNLYLTNGR